MLVMLVMLEIYCVYCGLKKVEKPARPADLYRSLRNFNVKNLSGEADTGILGIGLLPAK